MRVGVLIDTDSHGGTGTVARARGWGLYSINGEEAERRCGGRL